MPDREVNIRITGDSRDYQAAVDGAERATSGFGDSFSAASVAIGVGAAIFAGGQILDFGQDMLAAGTQVDVWGIKVDTVFGDSAADIRAWADDNNESLGVTDDALAGMAAGLGDLLVPLGFTREQAAEMSTTSLDLAGALSAWSGGTQSVTDVSQVLQSAMLGETDGLKALGISISAADVAARLAAEGHGELTGAARAQAEAQATLDLVLERSTDAQTAWSDGSMDAIQHQNELRATTAELRESLAVALLPALQGIVDVLVTRLIPGVQSLAAEWGPRLAAMWDGMQPGLAAIGAALGTFAAVVIPVLIAAFEAVVAWVRSNWPQISATIGAVMTTVQTVIQAAVAVIQAVWANFGDLILTSLRNTWNLVSGVISAAMTIIRGIMQTVTAIIRGDWGAAWQGILTILSGVWALIQTLVSSALAILRNTIDIALRAIALLFSTIWDGIRLAVVTIMNAIRTAVVAAWNALSTAVSAVVDALALALRVAWNGIRLAVITVVNGIQTAVVAVWNALSTAVSAVVSALSSALSTAWNGIRTAVVTVVNALREAVVAVFERIRDRCEEIITTAGQLVAAAFRIMRETAVTIIDALRDRIVTIFETLRDRLGNIITTIGTAAERGFNTFKDLIMVPINFVMGLVQGLIDLIGRIPTSIPNPLSGFSGGGAISSIVSGAVASVPSPTSARAWGGLVTSPEIALIGEAGPELVLPLTQPGRTAELLRAAGLSGPGGSSGSRFGGTFGAAGGGTVNHIHVTALTETAARSYAQLIADELRRLDRSAA